MGEEAIRVAILGRPNVGKSSLLNALLGEERVIVSEVPGTTRDAIDTVLQRGDRTFVLVDTAGLRRKRKQRQGIEYYSELRALEAAERADVALVLVDASEGLVDQDLTVADIARKAQVLDARRALEVGRHRRSSSRTSARGSSRGCGSARRWSPSRRRPAAGSRGCSTGSSSSSRSTPPGSATGELNRFLAELREARQPPSRNGKRLNLLYGTQVQARPPRFRFFVNDPGLITRDYGYWVENQLRERFELQGVPVSIDFVRRVMNGCRRRRGSWGTAFARLLAARGHDVTLAARDPEQARAIEETGRNPRYLPDVDLEGIGATTVDDARRWPEPTSSSSPCRATPSPRWCASLPGARRCSA